MGVYIEATTMYMATTKLHRDHATRSGWVLTELFLDFCLVQISFTLSFRV